MSSDGVLLQPGIGMVNDLPLMQKKVRRKIRLNYGWAFLYNSVGVFLASMGWLSPKYCAVGMVFSNLVVIYNSIFGMKLKKIKFHPILVLCIVSLEHLRYARKITIRR